MKIKKSGTLVRVVEVYRPAAGGYSILCELPNGRRVTLHPDQIDSELAELLASAERLVDGTVETIEEEERRRERRRR
jgi:hypothetical protein